MCDVVHLSDGRTCRTIADLLAAGFAVEDYDRFTRGGMLPDGGDESCLCCVDVEAVLNRTLGNEAEWGWTPEDGYWSGVPS